MSMVETYLTTSHDTTQVLAGTQPRVLSPRQIYMHLHSVIFSRVVADLGAFVVCHLHYIHSYVII